MTLNWELGIAIFMFVAGILIGRASESPRKPSSHLCVHINGAHRCRCKRRGDHSDANHDSTIVPQLYDWEKKDGSKL